MEKYFALPGSVRARMLRDTNSKKNHLSCFPMSVTFDFNFWTFVFALAGVLISIGSLISARGRASSERMELMFTAIRAELASLKDRNESTHSRFGERIQGLETSVSNGINTDDLAAVHRRVDQIHEVIAGIRSDVGTVKGILQGWEYHQNHRSP